MQNEISTGRRVPIPFTCIPDLLEHQAKRIPDAPAILAPAREPLTYDLLYQHVQKTARILRTMGIGRHDRVAVVLPNGPELPVAILWSRRARHAPRLIRLMGPKNSKDISPTCELER